MARPVPSAAELVRTVKSLTRQTDGTFQTAWSDSFTSPSHCVEQGGFIYVDFPVPATLTRVFVTRAPKGATMNQRTEGPNASIDLNRPNTSTPNVVLAANFHTHPLSTRVKGDPYPSPADMTNAYARGLPGIVVSRDGIYSYGPERRENVARPLEYPPAVEAPGFPRAILIQAPQPPWTVPNQWPEGTGLTRASLEDDMATEEVEVIHVD